MTKVGTFAGSAYIKYMIDAMLELKQDEEDEFIKYMIFSKNRDGKIGIRLYYSIGEHGIEYNLSRYKSDMDVTSKLYKNQEYTNENNNDFNKIFNI